MSHAKRGEPDVFSLVAGLLTVVLINVATGILADLADTQIAGDLQLLVWVLSLLAGILVVIFLQRP